MKKGIIFDMDGTLWDSAANVAESWNLAIKQNGSVDKKLTEQDIQGVMGKTMDVIADILFPEGLYDFIVCPLLKLIQRIQFDDLLHLLVQPADLMMINLKYLFLYQTVQNGRRHIGALQQFFLGDFFRDFISQNPRTFHIFHQQCQLLRGTRQDIKQYMQPFFIRRPRKPHPRLRLGFISTPQLLLYKNRFFIEQ